MRKNRANYSFGEKIQTAFSLLYTKLFWKGARLIRKGNRIRGRKSFSFGKGFTTGYNCRIEINGKTDTIKLKIGDHCIIGDYAHIVANYQVVIGNNVLMASRVFISDTNHGVYKGEDATPPSIAPNDRLLSYQPVEIGDNVWLGENVVILPGVKLGNGCIVGASSVVTKNFSGGCIIAGNPARIIKRWNGQEWCAEKE